MCLKAPNGNIEKKNINIAQFFELRRKGYKRLDSRERIFIAQEERRALEAKKKGLRDFINVHFISSNMFAYDGYSASALLLKKDIEKHGVFLNDEYEGQEICLNYHLPNTLVYSKAPKNIIFSMFETTKYPEFWGEWWAKADRRIVPSRFCSNILKNQFGLECDVVPLGYEPDKFYLLDRIRPDDHIFTFLHFDAFKYRKGWDIVLNAFDDEFGADEPVRLVFKTTVEKTTSLSEYPKVEVIKKIYTLDELRDMMQKSDCFVFPSRGEGFGLTPLECMATGMPIIVPDHTGMHEYFDESLMERLDCVGIKPRYDNVEFAGLDLGTQFQPTIASVRKAMRAEYNKFKLGQGTRMIREMKLARHAKRWQAKYTAQGVANIIKSLMQK